MSNLKEAVSKGLANYFPTKSAEYSKVSCLLIYWADDDLGCKVEVEKMQDVLRARFLYSTRSYLIPSQKSQAALSKELANFVCEDVEEGTLGIIYYAGHSSASDEDKRAIWAAQECGGAQLGWNEVQPLLYAAEGDVLVILDCCYAARAARAQEAHRSGSRLELLAASGMNVMTPGVGRFSFTSGLLSRLRLVARQKDGISVVKLHRELLRETVGLTETAIYVNLSKDASESIILRRLPASVAIANVPSYGPPKISLSLKVYLLQEPNANQLINWIKAAAPPSISRVTIEDVVHETQQLQRFLLENSEGVGLDHLSEDSKEELLQKLQDFGGPSLPNTSWPLVAGATSGQQEALAEKFVKDLKDHNENLTQSIKANILSEPQYQNVESLQRIENTKVAQAIGLSSAIGLRTLSLSLEELPDVLMLTREDVVEIEQHEEIGKGVLVSRNQQVLLENKSWVKDHGGFFPEVVKRRVIQLASLLKRQQDPDFRVLPFEGYYEDFSNSSFVFVFQTPPHVPRNATISTLRTEIPLKASKRRLSLDSRIRLAYQLALSMFLLHTVGWVHKSLRSDKILFFNNNMEEPWVTGFEYARPESDFSSQQVDDTLVRNLYRHPDRWGLPTARFKKMHEIYALGIILLEIGLWQRAETMSLDRSGEFDEKNSWAVQRAFLKQAQTRLAPATGNRYTKIVLKCLSADESAFGITVDDKVDSKLLRAFQNEVLNPLKDIADHVG